MRIIVGSGDGTGEPGTQNVIRTSPAEDSNRGPETFAQPAAPKNQDTDEEPLQKDTGISSAVPKINGDTQHTEGFNAHHRSK